MNDGENEDPKQEDLYSVASEGRVEAELPSTPLEFSPDTAKRLNLQAYLLAPHLLAPHRPWRPRIPLHESFARRLSLSEASR